MARRREARRLAVDVLYQADLTGRDALEILEERRGLGTRVSGYAEALVRGVTEGREEIDRILEEHAEDWSVARMAAVDRAILRVACHEIVHRDDIPPAVAIDEAVTAAKRLSTEDSGRFVNGVLGAVARAHAEHA